MGWIGVDEDTPADRKGGYSGENKDSVAPSIYTCCNCTAFHSYGFGILARNATRV